MSNKTGWVAVVVAVVAAFTGLGGTAKAASVPTVSISASPMQVTAGERSRISWSSTNARACTGLGHGNGDSSVNGSRETRRLTEDETFELTCTGKNGSATASVTVTVIAVAAKPTVSISANPGTVTAGGRTSIVWSSTNATACTGSGAWTGSEALNGTLSTGALTTDVTFGITCTGPGGTTMESVTAAVTAAAKPGTVTFSWTPPTSLADGSPVTDLAGYHIYYGNSASSLAQAVVIMGAAVTSYQITGLSAGTWYFAAVADTADGTESAVSQVVAQTI